MNEILTDLIEVINLIDKFYYSVPKVTINGDQMEIEDEIKLYERRFAGQLKSEYDRFILTKNNQIYNVVKTDIEIIKKYVYGETDKRIVIGHNKMLNHFNHQKIIESITTIPDFFIHKAQDNFDTEYQKLILEIKTCENLGFEDFCLDLFKLNIYVDKFNYQNGVFLILNNEKVLIENFIQEYNRLNFYKFLKKPPRIYFFIKENYNSEIEILTFIPKINRF